ncbi:MAG: hypothetical protein BDTLLHRC_001141 [Candidatus Fervidibacter sp.]
MAPSPSPLNRKTQLTCGTGERKGSNSVGRPLSQRRKAPMVGSATNRTVSHSSKRNGATPNQPKRLRQVKPSGTSRWSTNPLPPNANRRASFAQCVGAPKLNPKLSPRRPCGGALTRKVTSTTWRVGSNQRTRKCGLSERVCVRQPASVPLGVERVTACHCPSASFPFSSTSVHCAAATDINISDATITDRIAQPSVTSVWRRKKFLAASSWLIATPTRLSLIALRCRFAGRHSPSFAIELLSAKGGF